MDGAGIASRSWRAGVVVSDEETLVQLGDAIGAILVVLIGPSRPGGIPGLKNWAVARRAEERECLRLGQSWNPYEALAVRVIELFLEWRLARKEHHLLVQVAIGIARMIAELAEREL